MENELFDMVEGYDANSRSIKLISKAAEILNIDKEKVLDFIQPQDIRVYRLHVKLYGQKYSVWSCTSLHNRSRGPYKGGIRIAPDVNVFEVIELSRLMTVKTACMGIEFGGAKTGIRFDMKGAYKIFDQCSYSQEFESNIKREILHEFSHLFKDTLQSHTYVPAPDIGTNPIDMAQIYNETNDPSSVTGKPKGMPGWLPGRNEATGYGVAACGIHLLDDLSINPKNATAVIQGFGNVGMHTALFLAEKGVKIIAISDAKAAVYNKSGLDIKEMAKHTKDNGSIQGYNAKEIKKEDIFEIECDLLIPAAISNVITEDNVDKIKAKGIVEAANMPIDYKAEKVLAKKDIKIIPDIIANAGGVIASGEEYSKSLSARYIKKEDTYNMITERIISNLNKAKKIAKEKDISLNMAAYVLAIKRLYDAHKIRGWV